MTTQTEGIGWSAVLTQMPERFTENYKAAFSTSQAIVTRWIKDCSDQIQTNLNACTKLANCKDAGEIAGIQQRWWQDTIERMGKELEGVQGQLMALSQKSLSGLESRTSPRPYDE